MKGNKVIIRTYGGKPLIRRVWEEHEKIILITDDIQFGLLESGEEAIMPIGFPREDVFKYDHELAMLMEHQINKEEWDWGKLVPY